MYIVAYDISKTRERNSVIKVLSDYGERVQESVWICDMNAAEYAELKKRLEKLKVASGFVSIWQARSVAWKTGNESMAPVRPWAHCF